MYEEEDEEETEDDKVGESNHEGAFDHLLDKEKDINSKIQHKSMPGGEAERTPSEYDEIKHPNMMSEVESRHSSVPHHKAQIGKSMRQYNKRKKKDCKYFFAKLDYEILRPLLIYNYERDEMHRQDDYIELLIQDVNMLGSVYGKVDPNLLQKSNDGDDKAFLRVSQAVHQIGAIHNNRR